MAIDKQLLKGTLPLLVLHLLTQADMYGYQLIKALDQLSSGVFRFGEGSLYPVLHTLERDGNLRSFWRESDSGRNRKYYAITPDGRAMLDHRAAEWQRFSGAIDAILTGQLPQEAPDA